MKQSYSNCKTSLNRLKCKMNICKCLTKDCRRKFYNYKRNVILCKGLRNHKHLKFWIQSKKMLLCLDFKILTKDCKLNMILQGNSYKNLIQRLRNFTKLLGSKNNSLQMLIMNLHRSENFIRKLNLKDKGQSTKKCKSLVKGQNLNIKYMTYRKKYKICSIS